MDSKPNVAVIVATENRSVWFGYTDDTTGDKIVLENARNCIYWSRSIGGYGGLAAIGPDANCRIGVQVPKHEARGVIAVSYPTPAAISKWENADVYRG